MTIHWPENLPAPQFGLAYDLANPQINGDLAGYNLYRRRFTGVPVEFQARWIMDSESGVEFEAFYKETVKDGTLWFAMRLQTPHALRNYYVRFAGPYSFKKITPYKWEYSAVMEMYLRPASYELPTIEDPEP